MNVVIYARFSSHNQTEQSIEGQLKVCYEYAESHNYTVLAEYIDRAQSGKFDKDYFARLRFYTQNAHIFHQHREGEWKAMTNNPAF